MAVTVFQDRDHRGYIDLNQNELRNPRAHQLAADPGTPVNGQWLYRTDTHKVRWRVNGAWQDMATMADVTAGGISSSLVDAKGDLIVATADNTVVRKGVGADGTFLVAASAQADGLQWRTIADADLPGTIARDAETVLQTLADAKGDLVVATAADTFGRLAVGADGAFLVAASGQATGQQWRVLATADLQEKIATADLTDWPRTAALDLNGQKITGLADGTATTDAATFGQMVAAIEGRAWKDPVAAATTANITLSGAQTIDGVAVVAGDRVLAKNQTATAQNGIYVAAAGAWARAVDANTAAELNNSTVLIEAGTVNGGDTYTMTSTVTTLGTDAVTWTKSGEGNTVYTADGTTITLTGNSFSVTTGGIANAQIAAAAAIAYSKLNLAGSIVNADVAAAAAIAYSKLNLAGSIVNADIATGAAIAGSKTDGASATGRVALVSSGVLTGGATTEVITHNLNTRNVKVGLRNPATPWDEVEVENRATTVNTVTLASPVNLPAGYEWTVIGR